MEAVEHPESVVMVKIPTVQFRRQILTALSWILVMNLATVIMAVWKWKIAAQILKSFVEVRSVLSSDLFLFYETVIIKTCST